MPLGCHLSEVASPRLAQSLLGLWEGWEVLHDDPIESIMTIL
jgi:hypothetical protein